MIMKKKILSTLAILTATLTFTSCAFPWGNGNEQGSGSGGDKPNVETPGGNENVEPNPNPSTSGGRVENGVFVFGDGKKIEGDATLAPSALPTYTSENKFRVTSWGAPDLTEEQIDYFLDAGFNTAICFSASGYGIGTQNLADALTMYGEHDIDTYIHTGNGWQQRGNGLQLGGATNPTYFYKSVKKFFEAGVDYTEYEAFIGVMVFDEPGGAYGTKGEYNDFDFLEEEWRLFKGLWEGCEIDGVWYDPVFHNGSYKDYQFHINTCGDKQYLIDPMVERIYPMVLADEGNISVFIDHYPLAYNATDDVPTLKDTYLFYYDMCGDIAKTNNISFGTHLLTGQMNSVLGYARGDDMDGYWSEAELRWQTFSMMAFGGTEISYFTYYRTPTESGSGEYIGIIDSVGKNKTKAYDYTKNANEEFHKFFPVFDNFEYLGTTSNVGTRNKNGYNSLFDAFTINSVASHYRIGNFKSSRDTLIGMFKDANGYDGFLIVNHEDPYYKRVDELEVTFNNATKAIVCNKGEQTVVELQNGTLKYSLEWGDGIFVIPLA